MISANELRATTLRARSRLMAAARIALRDRSPILWIMVVGTGKYDLNETELGVARTVGRQLARWGYGLITGGWQGVDYVTAEAYAEQLATNDIPADTGLLHVLTEGGQAVFRQGTTLSVRDTSWMAACISRADAVVAIGGAGATLTVCRMAVRIGKPVFPIPGTGGDAQTFYNEMTEEARSEVASLDRPRSTRAYYGLAQTLVELLREKLPPPSQGDYDPAV